MVAARALRELAGRPVAGVRGARVDPRGAVFPANIHLSNREGQRARWSSALEAELKAAETQLRKLPLHVLLYAQYLANCQRHAAKRARTAPKAHAGRFGRELCPVALCEL